MGDGLRSGCDARGGELLRGTAIEAGAALRGSRSGLIFILVGVVAGLLGRVVVGGAATTVPLRVWRGVSGAGKLGPRRGAAEVFGEARGNLFEEARGNAGFRHVRPLSLIHISEPTR